MLIDSTYFIGERNIPNTDRPEVSSLLDSFIVKYEGDYLRKALGYELQKALSEALLLPTVPQRFIDLLFGVDFTDNHSTLQRWPGFISYTGTTPTAAISLPAASDLFFTIGQTIGAPVNGATEYNNTALASASYRVIQRGFGPLEILKDDNSNIATADIELLPAGGFKWRGSTTFSDGDKYTIQFLSSPIDVSGVEVVPLPESPIADYIYYHFLKFAATQTTGIGEVKAEAQNAMAESSQNKMVQAWNDMALKTKLLWEWLSNSEDFPEFKTYYFTTEACQLVTFKNRYQ